MMQPLSWPRRFVVVLLALLCLACGQGCLSFCHSLDAPPKEQIILGEKIPAPCRNRVHIFILHGLDPLDLANLCGLTEYIHQLGYCKTHYGQFFHMWSYKKEIRRIHKEDPQARFVVIGFSLGSYMARELVNCLKEDNIPIDLLLYIGGFTLNNSPKSQPENVCRIVNILCACIIWDVQIDRAENIHYSKVWHFGLPTHPRTREILACDLAQVALRVPFVDSVPPLSPQLQNEVPMPRQVTPDQLQQMSSQLPPEWGFLNSRSASGEAPPPTLARPTADPNARRVPFCILP